MAVRHRPAARIIVLTPDERVLLMSFRLPWRSDPIWLTPGGGIEAGETAREAAVRELREETGLEVDGVGAELWTRTHHLVTPDREVVLRERFFLVEVPAFEPAPALEGDEEAWFRHFSWWHVSEMARSQEAFAPTGLADHLGELLRNGPPAEPFEVPT